MSVASSLVHNNYGAGVYIVSVASMMLDLTQVANVVSVASTLVHNIIMTLELTRCQ